MSVSLRTMPDAEREQREADIAGKWADLSPHLDERSRRLWLAAEARRLGYGGIKFVASATGAAIETVRAGLKDLAGDPVAGVRRAGAGRKKAEADDPELLTVLDGLLDDDPRGTDGGDGDGQAGTVAGDPMSPRLRWTSKSLVNLSRELGKLGYKASPTLVRRLTLQMGWRLQSNNKSMEKGARHPDRNGQFRYINRLVAGYLASGDPIVSVDAKKKEKVGAFKNGGTEWRRSGEPVEVFDHDYPSWAEGKAIPYGIYDLAGNSGFVSVGDDHDTPAFAVASLETWWTTIGAARYPGARRLLITADSGGSNSARSRAYKKHLAAFAERHQITVTLAHYPSGTSKWNRVEHRLFSFISINWRGKPLTSYETILELIGNTTTSTGLTVTAHRDSSAYPTGEKASNKEMKHLETRITRHDWHGDWNYTIHPTDRPEI